MIKKKKKTVGQRAQALRVKLRSDKEHVICHRSLTEVYNAASPEEYLLSRVDKFLQRGDPWKDFALDLIQWAEEVYDMRVRLNETDKPHLPKEDLLDK